jgi:hypothetical protein
VTRGPKDVAASIAARLLNQAKASGRSHDELLTYYAIERFLFRFASTSHKDRFVLKGALMLPVWGITARERRATSISSAAARSRPRTSSP